MPDNPEALYTIPEWTRRKIARRFEKQAQRAATFARTLIEGDDQIQFHLGRAAGLREARNYLMTREYQGKPDL